MPADFSHRVLKQSGETELTIEVVTLSSLDHRQIDVFLDQHNSKQTSSVSFVSRGSGKTLYNIPLPGAGYKPVCEVSFAKKKREFTVRLCKEQLSSSLDVATQQLATDKTVASGSADLSSERDQHIETDTLKDLQPPQNLVAAATPSEMPHSFQQLLNCPEDLEELEQLSGVNKSLEPAGEDNSQAEKKKKKNKKKKKKSAADSQQQEGDGAEDAEEQGPETVPEPITGTAAVDEDGDGEPENEQPEEGVAKKKKKKKKKSGASTTPVNDTNISPDQSTSMEAKASPKPEDKDSGTAVQNSGEATTTGTAEQSSQPVTAPAQEEVSWFLDEPDAVTTFSTELPPNPMHGPRVVMAYSKSEHKGEDKWAQYPSNSWTLQGSEAATTFTAMGLFDGHGGKHSATYASKHLLPTIMALADRAKSRTEPLELEGADPDDVAVWQTQEQLIERLPKALKEGFLEADKVARQRFKTSGSTATVAVSVGWELLVANIGDSHAFLDTGAEVVQLTGNHRADDNADERERVTKAGGHVSQARDDDGKPIGPLRVWPGGIAFCRSIGDYESQELLSADPEIRQISLPPTGGRLIIASDGLWDHMNAKTIIHQLRKMSAATAVHTAMHTALKKKGLCDDITVMVADFFPGDVQGSTLPALAGNVPAHSIEHHNFWKPLETSSNAWRERLRQHRTSIIAAQQAQASEQEAAVAAVLERQQELERLRAEAALLQVQRETSQLSETYRELAELRVDTSALESLPVEDGEWQTVKTRVPTGATSFMDELMAAARLLEETPPVERTDSERSGRRRDAPRDRPRGGRGGRDRRGNRNGPAEQHPAAGEGAVAAAPDAPHEDGAAPAAEQTGAGDQQEAHGPRPPRKDRRERRDRGGRGPQHPAAGQDEGAGHGGQAQEGLAAGAAAVRGLSATTAEELGISEQPVGRQRSFQGQGQGRGTRRPPRDYPPRGDRPPRPAGGADAGGEATQHASQDQAHAAGAAQEAALPGSVDGGTAAAPQDRAPREGRGRRGRGPRYDGLRQDGQRYDGPRQDGQRYDGPRQDGQRYDGQRYDGPRQDGQRYDGPRQDGQRYDGPRQDSQRYDGPRQDGQRYDGPRYDGPRQDGQRYDEPRQAGQHHDGPPQDGQRYDGPRQEGQRYDAPRQEGQRYDGPRQGGRSDRPRNNGPRRDGRPQTEGQQQHGAAPEGQQQGQGGQQPHGGRHSGGGRGHGGRSFHVPAPTGAPMAGFGAGFGPGAGAPQQ